MSEQNPMPPQGSDIDDSGSQKVHAEFDEFVRADEAHRDTSFRDYLQDRNKSEAASWYNFVTPHGEAPEGEVGDLGNGDDATAISNRTDAERLNAQEGKDNPTEDDVDYYRWLKKNSGSTKTEETTEDTTPEEPTPGAPEGPETPTPEDGEDEEYQSWLRDNSGDEEPSNDEGTPEEPVDPSDSESHDDSDSEEPEEPDSDPDDDNKGPNTPSPDSPNTPTPAAVAVELESEESASQEVDDDGSESEAEPDTSGAETTLSKEEKEQLEQHLDLLVGKIQKQLFGAEIPTDKINYDPSRSDRGANAELDIESWESLFNFLASADAAIFSGESHTIRTHQLEGYGDHDEAIRDEIMNQLSRIFNRDIEEKLNASEKRGIELNLGPSDKKALGLDDPDTPIRVGNSVYRSAVFTHPKKGKFIIQEFEFPNTVHSADGTTRERMMRIISFRTEVNPPVTPENAAPVASDASASADTDSAGSGEETPRARDDDQQARRQRPSRVRAPLGRFGGSRQTRSTS